jgi:ribosomal protein S18 acetylase RimI-like enzyme
MQLVMDAPPAAPRWPPGLVGHPFRPGRDEQAAYAADEEASLDKDYHTPLTFEQWAVRMDLNGERFDPGLWFVAWDGPEAAGVSLSYHDAASGIGWIDHLGVRRPWRGRGLGQALLWQAFTAFYARGVRRVRLNVDTENRTQAQRVYERAGMRTLHEYHIYVKELALTL